MGFRVLGRGHIRVMPETRAQVGAGGRRWCACTLLDGSDELELGQGDGGSSKLLWGGKGAPEFSARVPGRAEEPSGWRWAAVKRVTCEPGG